VKKRREAAIVAEKAIATKSLGAQWLVVVTSASLISLFVVMPYTVGYFLYFDLAYLAFFTIADYYLFSALPLFIAIVLFGIQYYASHLAVRLDRYFHPEASPSAGKPQRTGTFSLVFTAFFFLVLGVSVIYASVGVTVAIAGFVFIILLGFFGQAKNWTSGAFYFSIALLALLLLMGWGFLNAHSRVVEKKSVQIFASGMDPTQQDKAIVTGNLLFAGTSGILFFDSTARVYFVHLESGLRVSAGLVVPKNIIASCFFGMNCFQLPSTEAAQGRDRE
jgi:hypothetical protein